MFNYIEPSHSFVGTNSGTSIIGLAPRVMTACTGPFIIQPADSTIKTSLLPEETIRSSNSTTILSIVVPTFNEAENIRELVERLRKILDTRLHDQYEIIVVDDNSLDETNSIVVDAMNEIPQLKLVCRKSERGLASAVIRGWQLASGSILGVLDGDLQQPPEIIGELLEEIVSGADLAIATRYKSPEGVVNWNFMRKCASRSSSVFGRMVLPQVFCQVSDPLSGYFLIKRDMVDRNEFFPMGYKILVEVLSLGRASRISEVPYQFLNRRSGNSKLTARVIAEFFIQILRLRISRKTKSTMNGPFFGRSVS